MPWQAGLVQFSLSDGHVILFIHTEEEKPCPEVVADCVVSTLTYS